METSEERRLANGAINEAMGLLNAIPRTNHDYSVINKEVKYTLDQAMESLQYAVDVLQGEN